jgi:hypothetical protein
MVLPALLWTPAFWDALLVLGWLAVIGLVIIFGLASVLTPHYTWSVIATPLLSTAFVVISIARFIAVRNTQKRWLLLLLLGQLSASVTLLWLSTTRPPPAHWVINVVEHGLAGSAVALAIYVASMFFTCLAFGAPRHSQADHIRRRLQQQQQLKQ